MGLKGIANLGKRPTFASGRELLEVCLLDFRETIYGKRIQVRFLRFLRPEKQFESVEALKDQIKRDYAMIAKARPHV